MIFPHHMEWRHRFEDDNYLYFIYHSRSKAADTFAAMGPWITTADEVPGPQCGSQRIRGYVDGDVYADDSTDKLFLPGRTRAFRGDDLVHDGARRLHPHGYRSEGHG